MSFDEVQTLLESEIEIQEAILKNATDDEARDQSKRRIEGLKDLQKILVPESDSVEISDDELRRVFDELEEIVDSE